MQRFVITKSTREYVGGRGYDGPSCSIADVPSGEIYTDQAEAQVDAQALNNVNPVGFEVVPYQDLPVGAATW